MSDLSKLVHAENPFEKMTPLEQEVAEATKTLRLYLDNPNKEREGTAKELSTLLEKFKNLEANASEIPNQEIAADFKKALEEARQSASS